MYLMHRSLPPTASLIASLLLVAPAVAQAEENAELADMEVTMTVLTSEDALPEVVTHEIPLPALVAGSQAETTSDFGQATAREAQEHARELGQGMAEHVRGLREDGASGHEFGSGVAAEASRGKSGGNGGGRKARRR